ncbi:MAG: type II secretion system protein [Erysipelotrichaceae bacterium]|nr:type II secretion system protein [Erysipelotrichaceae bacterium]
MKNKRKGFTLIELVIVIALIGIISAAMVTVVRFTSQFFKSEDSKIARQENVRIVAVNFEKDIRKSHQTLSIDGGCVITNDQEYCLVDDKIYRNNIRIASQIADFQVTIADDLTYLDLAIISTPDERGDIVIAQTRIYLRKGD